MLQATAVRIVSRFLEDPLDVPWPVVEYLAGQLSIVDASCVKRYTDRAMTVYEHAWQLREAYGLRVFEDVEAAARLRQFLDGWAWASCSTRSRCGTPATSTPPSVNSVPEVTRYASKDAARLSPLGHAHVSELGGYALPAMALDADLRPIRDPQANDEG
ncbi:MAG: hypothetical protein DLM58_19685 [Pseudonocardiales bacterium]|nr:MAG: hypothetical protein DLM58_19685 [Pseudonocardiales bacterium]